GSIKENKKCGEPAVARERRRQPRGGSNRHVSKGLLERLEAENAQLRGRVANLMLQIQALRDALGRPQSGTYIQSVPSSFGPQIMISLDCRLGTGSFQPWRFFICRVATSRDQESRPTSRV